MSAMFFFAGPVRTIHAPADNDPESTSTANLVHPGFPSTDVESIMYNYFCYVLPFIIGLHFRLLDTYPFYSKIQYAVTWPLVKESYGPKQFVFLGISGLLLLGTAGFHAYLIYEADLGLVYLPLFVAVIFFVPVFRFLLRNHFAMNLRYFMVFGFLVVFTPFQNVVSAITQGLLLGITVEGISTKGLKPLFLLRPYSVYATFGTAMLPLPQNDPSEEDAATRRRGPHDPEQPRASGDLPPIEQWTDPVVEAVVAQIWG